MPLDEGQKHWVGCELAEIKWKGVCVGGRGEQKRMVVERPSGQRQWQDPCYIWQKSTAMDW